MTSANKLQERYKNVASSGPHLTYLFGCCCLDVAARFALATHFCCSPGRRTRENEVLASLTRFQNSASASPFPLITADCAPGCTRSDRKAPIVELTGRCFVRAGVGVGRVTSKRFTQAPQSPNPKRQKAFGARVRDDQPVLSPTVGMRAPRYRLALKQDPNPTEQEPSTPLVERVVYE